MKPKIITLFVILLIISCSKENTGNEAHTTFQSDNVVVDTVKIPLNDLRNGTYKGSVGGLYPNGVNMPSGTYAADLLNVSKSIIPIDTFGRASSTSGYIVFLSLGASTGGQTMEELKTKTNGNPL